MLVFNAIFNNISAMSWRSVLLVKETGVTEENHQPGIGVRTKMTKDKGRWKFKILRPDRQINVAGSL
jgi:hypothetical protein